MGGLRLDEVRRTFKRMDNKSSERSFNEREKGGQPVKIKEDVGAKIEDGKETKHNKVDQRKCFDRRRQIICFQCLQPGHL